MGVTRSRSDVGDQGPEWVLYGRSSKCCRQGTERSTAAKRRREEAARTPQLCRSPCAQARPPHFSPCQRQTSPRRGSKNEATRNSTKDKRGGTTRSKRGAPPPLSPCKLLPRSPSPLDPTARPLSATHTPRASSGPSPSRPRPHPRPRPRPRGARPCPRRAACAGSSAPRAPSGSACAPRGRRRFAVSMGGGGRVMRCQSRSEGARRAQEKGEEREANARRSRRSGSTARP